MVQQERMEVCRRALGQMMALCSRREYAAGELREKLQKKELTVEEIAWVLEQLQQEGFQDDLRYAVAFARDKSRLAGWGERKIAYALHQKGIASELIRQAWLEVDEQEAWKKLVSLLSVKHRALLRQGREERDIYQRLSAYAQQKGYAWEQVQQYWKAFKRDNE